MPPRSMYYGEAFYFIAGVSTGRLSGLPSPFFISVIFVIDSRSP